MNLIDPTIIYSGLKDVNNNKQKNFYIQHFNIIEQSKKLNESCFIFSLPIIEKYNTNNIITTSNKKENEIGLEDSTFPIEKSISFFNQLNKDDKTEPEEVFKNDNKKYMIN